MKQKIIAFGVIFILVSITFSSINATDVNDKDQGIILKLSAFKPDGSLIDKIVYLKEKEYDLLENILEKTFKEIDENENDSIIEILMDFLKEKLPYLYEIIDTIIDKIDNRLSRTTICSYGQGYKFNPLKKTQVTFSLRQKRSGYFHYSADSKITGRTYLKYPYGARPIVIKGKQLGYMDGFVGLYIYVAKQFPNHSFTFFAGKARTAFTFKLPTLFNK